MRQRELARDRAKVRNDGFHRQLEEQRGQRGQHHGNQEGRPFRPVATQGDEQGERAEGKPGGGRIDAVEMGEIRLPAGEELGRQGGNVEAEQILDLAAENAHANAGGEAGDDWLRHVADHRAKAHQAGQDQHDGGHQGGHDQAVVTVGGDDAEDDRNEGGGWSANLHA